MYLTILWRHYREALLEVDSGAEGLAVPGQHDGATFRVDRQVIEDGVELSKADNYSCQTWLVKVELRGIFHSLNSTKSTKKTEPT